jgi:glycosyltransferase involved in cell wall biosynthesis
MTVETRDIDLSIVMPTYQASEDILDNINRILIQINDAANYCQIKYEIIVVDDYSDEQTYHLLESKIKPFDAIQLYRADRNQGPGLTRNLGALSAKGTWLWFLDDDDQLISDGLLRLLNMMKVSSAEVVTHSLVHQYEKSSIANKINLIKSIGCYQEKQEAFNFLFRRSFLKQHNLNFRYGLHEDIDYVFNCIVLAQSFDFSDARVISKTKRNNAITASMNVARIDGYLLAVTNMIECITKNTLNFLKPVEVISQTLGVILYLISREPFDAQDELLKYFQKEFHSRNNLTAYSSDILRFSEQDTNFKYVSKVWLVHGDKDIHALKLSVKQVFNQQLSCKDIDSSIFFAPDEIRACCKRFFVNGIQKGDVVLLKNTSDVSYAHILDAKNSLSNRLNMGVAPECSGCPYIVRRNKDLDFKINYISLENFAYCNMRCVYCSPKYYAGKEIAYDMVDIFSDIVRHHPIDDDCHVVFGGGEPTLSTSFESVNRIILATSQISSVRILSNSLKYSPVVYNLLQSNEKYQVVTSIDAGTEMVFNEIRGKSGLLNVLTHLRSYSDAVHDKQRIIIKYILTEDNCVSSELSSFVELVSRFELMGCLFQISCDFKLISSPLKIALAAYELAIRLYMHHASFVFFDDLIRDRLKINSELSQVIIDYLLSCNLDTQYVYTKNSHYDLVLWGDGLQKKWLMDSTEAGHHKLQFFVKNQQDFLSLPVHTLETTRILPAAVQGVYAVIKRIQQSGLSDKMARVVIL